MEDQIITGSFFGWKVLEKWVVLWAVRVWKPILG
jgi:hypothetical protein